MLNVIIENENKNEMMLQNLNSKLDEVGITDWYIFWKLNDYIFNPKTMTPAWDWVFDYTMSLKNIKKYMKIKWYKKSKITMEELFWLDLSKKDKTKLINSLDTAWLNDFEVLKQLKMINDSATIVIRLWKDDFQEIPDNVTRNSAHSEILNLKQYMWEDQLNVLNFFKIDQRKIDNILALT